MDRNRFESVGEKLAGDVAIDVDAVLEPAIFTDYVLRKPMSGGVDAMIADDRLRGRNRIIVDEWGPYDWKSPKLWPAGRSDDTPLKLRVLGPEGAWKLASVRGAAASPLEGRVPGEIVVTPRGTTPVDFTVALEYRGVEVVSPRGARTPAGAPYTFTYSRFFVPIDWSVRFFEYTDGTDPVKLSAGFSGLLAGTPRKTITTRRLDYLSSRGFDEGVAADRFALTAEGAATLPSGDYVLEVISDDGVRVWMDGAMLLDEWAPHESKVTRIPIRGGGGPRRFKVEYYEVDGFAELRFDIQRR
jgi:hypothetical protein